MSLVVAAIVVAASAAVLYLPMRKAWNADGSHDRRRAKTTPPSDEDE